MSTALMKRLKANDGKMKKAENFEAILNFMKSEVDREEERREK